jgi:general stress protein 26
MSELASYEQVSIYGLDDASREKLLSEHNECTFLWSTQEGWPIGVIMSYLWQDGRFWLTAGVHRHRISAVRRDDRVSVVVTSTGTKLGGGKSATAKGRCVVHEDRETKDWFYPAFSAHLYAGNTDAADEFCKFLDSPLRVVLEVVPEKWIVYDGVKMFKDQAGQLDENDKTALKSADKDRLPREIEKRGLSD